MQLPNHNCPNCKANQIVSCWWQFMTGFGHTYGHCTHCGVGLKLGDTSRWLVYPFVAAFCAVYAYCDLFVPDTILFFQSIPLIVLLVVLFIIAFPLGFLVAYFHRGVELVSESKKMVLRMKRQRVTKILAVSLLIVLLVIGTVQWMSSGPAWLLSARNSADGVIIEIYKEHDSEPTYSTLLEGRSIARDIQRVVRQDLPADVGATTFFDETIPPGRWTLVLGGAELDIMERALILDGGNEIRPHE
ncbi:MAG: hypothetical protein A2V70_12715 [Planctomycetes bacterium RBG_13_63_9]|nr:MAG: hypothetical protein A2V70_12715 [Planctomycetes bacterium RBG_13_63_9]